MRDHIDGVRSKFLPNSVKIVDIENQKWKDKKVRELIVKNDRREIVLGAYLPRSVLQRHHYSIWQSPKVIEIFFQIDFKDYVALYEIKDEETEFLAKLRWKY
jgi:hypothetical protein